MVEQWSDGQQKKPNGLYWKYKVNVEKTDGSPVDPNAEYLVLRIDKDAAARVGALAYADAVEATMPELARDIRAWVARFEEQGS